MWRLDMKDTNAKNGCHGMRHQHASGEAGAVGQLLMLWLAAAVANNTGPRDLAAAIIPYSYSVFSGGFPEKLPHQTPFSVCSLHLPPTSTHPHIHIHVRIRKPNWRQPSSP